MRRKTYLSHYLWQREIDREREKRERKRREREREREERMCKVIIALGWGAWKSRGRLNTSSMAATSHYCNDISTDLMILNVISSGWLYLIFLSLTCSVFHYPSSIAQITKYLATQFLFLLWSCELLEETHAGAYGHAIEVKCLGTSWNMSIGVVFRNVPYELFENIHPTMQWVQLD